MNSKTLTIKQVRSSIGRHSSHKACLRGLGINVMHKKVVVSPTPENLGMVRKISYMLEIEG